MHKAYTLRNRAIYERILNALGSKNTNKLARILEGKIARATVYAWSRGESEPSEENLTYISDMAGVSIDWLLGINEEDQRFRESPFYRLYIASKKAEPEDLRFIEDFIQISLKRLEEKSEPKGSKS